MISIKKIAGLIVSCCWCLTAFAQYGFEFDQKSYSAAKVSMFLLKNESEKIPLSNFYAQNLKHIYHGDLKNFRQNLDLYYSVTHEKYGSDHMKNHEKKLLLYSFRLDDFEFDQKEKDQLASVLKTDHVITVLFGTPEAFRKVDFDFSECSHLLFIENESAVHQSLAAQCLFGALPIDNRLPYDLGSDFQTGEGYQLDQHLRLGYAPPATVQMDSSTLHQNIAPIADKAIEAGAFPGCQVLVVKNKQVVFHETWGFHTYENKRSVKRGDLYDFASVTKITSALPAIMKLHGDGQLDLDAPLVTYFSKVKNTNKAQLNIRDILAHNARLKPWIPYWRSTIKKNGKFKWGTFKKRKSRRFSIEITDELFLHRKYKKKIYKAIKKSPLNETSGYKYSGLAFYLWPEMVESMVQRDFETYLKKTFYQPIGANTITYNPKRFFQLDQIIPTEHDTFFRNVQIHGKVHDEGAVMMGGVSANAGLFGSANDLAKLMQLYLNEGRYGGKQIIAADAVKEFTRCQFCEEGNRRGLGFDKPLIEYDRNKSSVAKAASPESYGHSGYTGTFVWVDPAYDLIYIFFSNRVYPTRENRKIYDLNVRPKIHKVIYDSFLQIEK